MASSSLSILSILSLVFVFRLPPSSSLNTLTLSLTPIFKQYIAPSQQAGAETNHHQWLQTINYLVSSSLARAHHLKNPNDNSSALNSEIPLFPRSYGGYSVSLNFGSPIQKLSFLMDTGSSLVWFPCTHRYLCLGCGFPNVNLTSISKFIPKMSSSAKIIGCTNRKCGWVFGSNIQCKGEEACPSYFLQYGSGTTSGLLLSDTLDFPEGDVTDFVVGCSILSTRQPAGIAGFGRGRASLPVQMNLKKFSYCLVSHRFDDAPVSSDLVLVRDSSNSTVGDAGMSYTKFRKNPVTSTSSFEDFYYVSLRKITVGGKTVKIPYGFLVPGSDGNGGTIIDSGTTFTYMDGDVYNLVAKEFETQMSSYRRVADVETKTGLAPCLDIGGDKTVDIPIPELMFHFKGGAKLVLPLADYFSFVGKANVLCMTIVSNKVLGSGLKSGPSIIIGNYQQQNIYVEYDLENGKLGFKLQKCK